MLTDFFSVFVFIVLGAAFVAVGLATAFIFRPHHPTPDKLSTYECGERPVGSPWIQVNIRFYGVALIFVIFDVEVLFLFPWAVVSKRFGGTGFIEVLIFVSILLVGLAYLWAKGDLEWVKTVTEKGDRNIFSAEDGKERDTGARPR